MDADPTLRPIAGVAEAVGARGSKRAMGIRFTSGSVKRHIRRHHPSCPPWVEWELIKRVVERSWREATLGKAVGLSLQNFIRHEMTDYDLLLKTGRPRTEARAIVAEEIKDWMALWARPKEAAEPTSDADGNQ